MKFMRCEIRKALGFVICLFLLLFNYSPAMQYLRELPDVVYVRSGVREDALFELPAPLTVNSAQNDALVSATRDESLTTFVYPNASEGGKIEIGMFGLIPVKTIALEVVERPTLKVGGFPIGVAVHTRGVLVVGTSEVILRDGRKLSPAASAGLAAGDIILEANGETVSDSTELTKICNAAEGEMTLVILRNDTKKSVSFQAALDYVSGEYKMGMWVRDSTAGIGTLSFYSGESLTYGALGHAIVDIDTSTIFTVDDGEITACDIVGINKGERGSPGELQGIFSKQSKRLGSIIDNTDFGITGTLYGDIDNPYYPHGAQLSYPDEAELGDATILTTLDDGTVGEYKCRIVRIYPQTTPEPKGMVIQITDPRLLELTGGIVQGMSGSPLMQNGRLLGVVTHVLINEPTKGYCMYAMWMYDMFDRP